MSEIDQQFIEYVVKSLVGKPDAVKITRSIDEKGVLLELTVDPEDLGRVIGKRGATAQSLRTLLRALGTKNDARYNLKIVDNSPEDFHKDRSDNRRRRDSDDELTEQPETKEEPAPETEDKTKDQDTKPEEDTKPEKEDNITSDKIKQAREELADLDDLDV